MSAQIATFAGPTAGPNDLLPAFGPSPSGQLFVVGIGASAGGLDALERFFDNLRQASRMAIVIVQHLSPDFKSLMDELLARHTRLPIHLVEDGMLVEGGHVYLIPPKKEMIISSGRLLLSERDRQQELTLPIDVFFRSLAQECGPRAVAIVLSGGGSDGSRGIRAVHEAGGLVVVQDTDSAQFDGMPRTAQEAGVARWVLAPEQMPAVLEAYVSNPPVPAFDVGVEPAGIAAACRALHEEFGVDFTSYKPTTVTRRIERRLALARSHSLQAYVERLRSDRDELDSLYRDLLIGVTRFFRDEEAFEVLESDVLPALVNRATDDAPLRVWVAGCATGEEAYSIAISIEEQMAKSGRRPVKIFATDMHRGSLERAALGAYDDAAVSAIPRDRLERYFLRSAGMYQVVPELRQMVVFAQHNVIKDAPFTRVDLVSCRNLLIYLQPSAQRKVLSLFHFALNRGGALFLGSSESVTPLAQDFETVDKHWQLHRKHSDARMPVETRLLPPLRVAPLTSPPSRYSMTQLLGVYDELLDAHMPPALLISDRGELVHCFGNASRFLRVRDGRQGLDAIDAVEPELRTVLVGGLRRAAQESSAIVFKGVRLGMDGDAAPYKVSIRSIKGRQGGAPQLLVTIEAMDDRAAPRPALLSSEIEVHQFSSERVGALEAELSHTKENLQAAVEELGTSNEELQASNEELQASNEELQSTNEELQSVNEELYTVNAEYQRKIGELTELTNDMDNLLSSTEVWTIFLDAQLRIRRFTPQIAETFHLVLHDVGRPIATFAHQMNQPELVGDLARVLATGVPIERELEGVGGRSFFMRILPYRVKGTIDGVVLTLIDVSGMKSAEDALFHERYLLKSLMVGVPDAIYFKDAHGRFIQANVAMARRLGLDDPRDAIGKSPFEMKDQELALQVHKEDEAVLQSGEAQHYRLERRAWAGGAEAWDLVTRLPLKDKAGHIVGVIAIFHDVTELRRSEEKTREEIRRRDQFLAMLSHELRNPVGAIVLATALLRSGEGTKSRVVDLLERQSHQMSCLLGDLLEVSRVTQNKIELKTRIVDMTHVARDAADAIAQAMESRQVTFAQEIAGEPVLVVGDAARLQQITVNLLSNAAKYVDRGGHVRLVVRRDGGCAEVRVTDDGVGIPHEMLETVFDLFVQSSRTLDRSAGGLGVGLTLVRSLVAMHEGTVTAASEGIGKGSEFVVRIPVAANAMVEQQVQTKERALVQGTKIVVVEDNADSRELLCELLTQAGFECHEAATGPDALVRIAEVGADVALLDVGLPGMDGFAVAREIRKDPARAGMYLIALTGYGRASDKAEAMSAGFDRHLVKPVDTDVLFEILAQRRGSAGDGAGRMT